MIAFSPDMMLFYCDDAVLSLSKNEKKRKRYFHFLYNLLVSCPITPLSSFFISAAKGEAERTNSGHQIQNVNFPA